ncbi:MULTISPECIES: helix-hairpin-helix domain-containing protein [unclassified Sphingomonas]|uniref:helix-hairpin-helix domain-containing protein n=1 Tax=unclassified Sphingomonas TaxID=196159 RepID=UPI00044AE97F|nr:MULTISPECIES: helix-hairpin-helix domain-containing protein [unclassified Sphingomonas]EZP48719.1 Helix-hairpin-helix repeat-containing competence protein ComEA [Sphingomonas sp. RIT328]
MSDSVNVNTATAEQLDAVPGLRGHGFEIVRYRGERGRFTDLRQLEEVPGLAGKIDDSRAALTVAD